MNNTSIQVDKPLLLFLSYLCKNPLNDECFLKLMDVHNLFLIMKLLRKYLKEERRHE